MFISCKRYLNKNIRKIFFFFLLVIPFVQLNYFHCLSLFSSKKKIPLPKPSDLSQTMTVNDFNKSKKVKKVSNSKKSIKISGPNESPRLTDFSYDIKAFTICLIVTSPIIMILSVLSVKINHQSKHEKKPKNLIIFKKSVEDTMADYHLRNADAAARRDLEFRKYFAGSRQKEYPIVLAKDVQPLKQNISSNNEVVVNKILTNDINTETDYDDDLWRLEGELESIEREYIKKNINLINCVNSMEVEFYALKKFLKEAPDNVSRLDEILENKKNYFYGLKIAFLCLQNDIKDNIRKFNNLVDPIENLVDPIEKTGYEKINWLDDMQIHVDRMQFEFDRMERVAHIETSGRSNNSDYKMRYSNNLLGTSSHNIPTNDDVTFHLFREGFDLLIRKYKANHIRLMNSLDCMEDTLDILKRTIREPIINTDSSENTLDDISLGFSYEKHEFYYLNSERKKNLSTFNYVLSRLEDVDCDKRKKRGLEREGSLGKLETNLWDNIQIHIDDVIEEFNHIKIVQGQSIIVQRSIQRVQRRSIQTERTRRERRSLQNVNEACRG